LDQKKSTSSQQVNPNEPHIFHPPPYQSNPMYQNYAPNMYHNYIPNMYQNYSSTLVVADTDGNVNNSNNRNISIQEFLESLDKKSSDGVFSTYLENFLEQCIEVQHIPELGNEEFISLGITKIGHRKTLIMEARKYKNSINL
jgi:hypothetical protein